MPYLFTHFKEKITPDGEQVYFGISRDGINWEQVNGGNPILTSTMSQKGCRDIEIVRLHTGGFVILTTDLGITYHFDIDEGYFERISGNQTGYGNVGNHKNTIWMYCLAETPNNVEDDWP